MGGGEMTLDEWEARKRFMSLPFDPVATVAELREVGTPLAHCAADLIESAYNESSV